jgi:hypothetical protein
LVVATSIYNLNDYTYDSYNTLIKKWSPAIDNKKPSSNKIGFQIEKENKARKYYFI